MKSLMKSGKSKRGFVFTTLLVSQLLLSACSGSGDAVQNADIQTATAQEPLTTSIAEPKVALEDSIFAAYIKPETLSKSLNSPVNDFTSTLNPTELAYLNQKLQDVYEEGLLQMGIVIVATTGDMPIYDYAMQVADTWALGSPENNNGLLIFVALNDRQMYILTGLDVEDKLSDERVSNIIDQDITPHFKKANYVTGLSTGIDALVGDMRN